MKCTALAFIHGENVWIGLHRHLVDILTQCSSLNRKIETLTWTMSVWNFRHTSSTDILCSVWNGEWQMTASNKGKSKKKEGALNTLTYIMTIIISTDDGNVYLVVVCVFVCVCIIIVWSSILPEVLPSSDHPDLSPLFSSCQGRPYHLCPAL